MVLSTWAVVVIFWHQVGLQVHGFVKSIGTGASAATGEAMGQ